MQVKYYLDKQNHRVVMASVCSNDKEEFLRVKPPTTSSEGKYLVLKNCCLFIQEFFSQEKKGSKLNFHKMNISIFHLFENRCYSTMILSNLHPHFGCFLSQCFGLFTLRPSSGVCHIWYLSRNVEYSSKVGILFSFFDFCPIRHLS